MPYRFVERKPKLGQKTQRMLWYINHECGGELRIHSVGVGRSIDTCVAKCNNCRYKLTFFTPRPHYACVCCRQEVSSKTQECLNVKCLTNIERVRL